MDASKHNTLNKFPDPLQYPALLHRDICILRYPIFDIHEPGVQPITFIAIKS